MNSNTGRDRSQDHIIPITLELAKIILNKVLPTNIDTKSILVLIGSIKIDLDNNCWLIGKDWSIYQNIQKIPAHRLSYHIFNGITPPPNREVCHHCDRKGCVNPSHLFIGTHSDNMQDARNKFRVFTPSIGHKYRNRNIDKNKNRNTNKRIPILKVTKPEFIMTTEDIIGMLSGDK